MGSSEDEKPSEGGVLVSFPDAPARKPSPIVMTLETAGVLYRPQPGGRGPGGPTGVPPDDGGDGPAGDGRPYVNVVRGQQGRILRETEMCLAAAPSVLFQRGGALVRPELAPVKFCDASEGFAPALHGQDVRGITRACAERVGFRKFNVRESRWRDADVPREIPAMIAGGPGQWQFPRIVGVISCPTLRRDGSLLSAPGFDAKSGFYSFWDGGDIGVPDAPTRTDAEAALEELSFLISEFCFIDDISRAGALSALLTSIVRPALRCAPIHAISAPAPGCGKSFLIDLAAMLATGRRCPVQSVSSDDIETEKQIVGALLAGYALINLDNVNREIQSNLLCQAVERPLIQLRALGASIIIEIENTSTFFATGNALSVSGDLVRRTLLVKLDPRIERPESREFSFDPVTLVAAERARYLKSALVIIKAYLASSARLDLPPLGSFADWSRMVRSPLVWLGVADPARLIETARDGDSALQALRGVLAFLEQSFGEAPFSAADVIDLIGKGAGEDAGFWSKRPTLSEEDRNEFRELLLNIAGRSGSVNGKRLSTWLTRAEGKIISERRLEKAERDARAKVYRWHIVKL